MFVQLSKFKLVFRTWENLALLANVRVFGGSLEPFYFSTTLMGYTRFILSFVISLWHYSCGMVSIMSNSCINCFCLGPQEIFR